MLLEAIPRTEGFKELLRQRRIHWMVLLVFSVGPKWEEKAFERIRRDFVQLRLLQQVVENALDFGEALPPRLFDKFLELLRLLRLMIFDLRRFGRFRQFLLLLFWRIQRVTCLPGHLYLAFPLLKVVVPSFSQNALIVSLVFSALTRYNALTVNHSRITDVFMILCLAQHLAFELVDEVVVFRTCDARDCRFQQVNVFSEDGFASENPRAHVSKDFVH